MATAKITRPVSWIKTARKAFEDFPGPVQDTGLRALTAVAEGGKPDIAKPLTGFPPGVLEIVLKHRGDAFRLVHAVQWDC